MAYDDREADAPTGWSPGAVVLVSVLVLVLGLGGAVVGVYFANQRPTPTPTSTLAADLGTAKPTPTPSVSPTPTATPSTADFELPDVTGLDFRQARDQLRAMKLGVTVTFTSGGEGDYKVDSTTPTAQ